MVSQRTLKIIGSVIQVGSYIHLFPAIWNSKMNHIVVTNRKTIFKIPYLPWNGIHIPIPVLLLLYQVSHATYLTVFLIIAEYSTLDICCATFLLCGLYVSISTQIIFISNFKSICALTNTFLDFDLQLRKWWCDNYTVVTWVLARSLFYI